LPERRGTGVAGVKIKGQVCVGECGDQASESLARRVGYMRR
jgi:hypothetical protein